jgi:hypothetical protein
MTVRAGPFPAGRTVVMAGLLAVAVAVVAVAVALVVRPGAVAPRPGPADSVGVRAEPQDPEAVREYWTPERMRDAQPAPMPQGP